MLPALYLSSFRLPSSTSWCEGDLIVVYRCSLLSCLYRFTSLSDVCVNLYSTSTIDSVRHRSVWFTDINILVTHGRSLVRCECEISVEAVPFIFACSSSNSGPFDFGSLVFMATRAARAGPAGSGGASAARGSAASPASGAKGPRFLLHCWNAGINSADLNLIARGHEIASTVRVVADLADASTSQVVTNAHWSSTLRIRS